MNATDAASAVAELGAEVWAWRLPRQFRTSDDIPRVDRPPGWLPSFSSAAADELRAGATHFTERLRSIDVRDAARETQVDHRLVGSALDRVRWEVDGLANWRRDAVFAVSQALGPWFDLLLAPPPFDDQRQVDLATVLAAVPRQLQVARGHLASHGSAPLARAAVALLADVDARLAASVAALAPVVASERHTLMAALAAEAGAALVDFRSWLDDAAPGMASHTAVGREAFVWFLRRVALCPSTPEELLAAGRQELARSVAWEHVAAARAAGVPLPPPPADAQEQVVWAAAAEESVRDFYETADLLSQPEGLGHYRNLPMPPWLAPISWLGVTDDLTGDDRLDQDGVSYVPDPSGPLGYFHAANARDPRAGIVHEGAHYQQLAMSWANPNPLRRRYYDSLANEGIAFYNEEMLLAAGLFDDAPHTRQVIWSFARLRALRVEVDVRLATGDLTLPQAVEHFVERVPMDHATAFEESAYYATNPGLAMSYSTGKLALQRLVAEAVTRPAPGSREPRTLREVHDHVWRNGNVPHSLLRLEMLGDASELDRIDADPVAARDLPA